ncbi:SET domain-containing protein [Ralstonia mannitolilytica]|uniref:SET domain-containing protein n=1 Tax=Ralstonia mannitolilytica TaxID=105219 RepID=UPI0009EE72FF
MTRTSADAMPAPAESPSAPQAPAKLRRRDRIEVRESGVHGRGVYAVVPIAKGKKIIEYKGEHISWKEALRRHPHDPSDPNHTFYFSLEDGSVIDAKYGGNRARWINHACKPNCEAREKDGRVFIHALRDIEPGEELFYDYGLVIEGRQTKALKEQFACHCGAKNCRGTMLAPPEKKKKKK